ncbi:hypothetical protein THF5G08_210017 [Vibrio jasicida]|nr:hypothetical protein THF5G08_210017 [Vibrio jasicida]
MFVFEHKILIPSIICSFLLAKIANNFVKDFEVRATSLLQSLPCSKRFFPRNP